LLVIVATGIHFVLDAALGAAVAGAALLVALAISTSSRSNSTLRRLPGLKEPRESYEVAA
jgi:hypothetical protein